jgi:hypothetical protein
MISWTLHGFLMGAGAGIGFVVETCTVLPASLEVEVEGEQSSSLEEVELEDDGTVHVLSFSLFPFDFLDVSTEFVELGK